MAKVCQITGGLRSDIQYIVVTMAMCIRLTYVRLSIHFIVIAIIVRFLET